MSSSEKTLFDSIKNECEDNAAWQISLRRWFHQHPELSFHEYETSKKIQEELTKLDIQFTSGWGKIYSGQKFQGGTGILAHIGTGKSPCVALRSDIDALPILEKNHSDFVSKNEGRMHACGHDAHMSILLGIAKYLKAHEKELEGTFKLIFQPAEEGGAGAKFMVDEGVLTENPPAEAILGLHVMPFFPYGHILGRPGPFLASATYFDAKIHGQGGHGSMPYRTKDPVTTAACIVQNVNNLVARRVSVTDETEAGVVSITAIQTPFGHNIIPGYAEMSGTIRALNDNKMDFLQKSLVKIVETTAEMYDQTAEVKFAPVTYPVTTNHSELYEWSVKQMEKAQFPNGLQLLTTPFMGSEDFSFYGKKIPACFYFLGSRPDKTGEIPEIHSNTFDIDEKCMPLGSTFLAYLAMQLLKSLKEGIKLTFE